MKAITKSIYDACEYYENNPQESITKIADMFGVDRHTITNRFLNYKNFTYLKDDKYYWITEKEKEPVLFFIENEEISLISVAKKFGVKPDTIKRRMEVMGYSYNPRYKRQYNRSIFNQIETEEQAYWLGFFLADGYINEERKFLSVKLGAIDKKHLEKLAIFFGDKIESVKPDNNCYFIQFSSSELVQDLLKYNLHQNKSMQEIPYVFNNKKLEIAYIRGMIDGDGHVEDGYFKYVGSLASCEYMKNFFGNYYKYNSNCSYIYSHDKIYSFEIRSQKVNQILKTIYSNATVFLDRKYQTIKNFDCCRD